MITYIGCPNLRQLPKPSCLTSYSTIIMWTLFLDEPMGPHWGTTTSTRPSPHGFMCVCGANKEELQPACARLAIFKSWFLDANSFIGFQANFFHAKCSSGERYKGLSSRFMLLIIESNDPTESGWVFVFQNGQRSVLPMPLFLICDFTLLEQILGRV